MRNLFAASICALSGFVSLYAYPLTYDPAGNLTADERRSLTYNSQNKLMEVASNKGSGMHTYKDSGSRLRKRFSLTTNAGQVTELLNPTRLMTQQAKPGARRGLVNHIYVNGVRIAAVVGPDAAGNPAIRYYHTDQVSSVKLVTDGTADVLQRHEYLPYGEEFPRPSSAVFAVPAVVNPPTPKFNSQEHDKESGLDFFNARHYDSKLAHFTSADTVIDGETSAAGWNRYLYVHGNPTKYADPSGNIFETDRDDLSKVYYADEAQAAIARGTDHPLKEALLASPLLRYYGIHLMQFVLEKDGFVLLLNPYTGQTEKLFSVTNCAYCAIGQLRQDESWLGSVDDSIPHAGNNSFVFGSREELAAGIAHLVDDDQYFFIEFALTNDKGEEIDYHVLIGHKGLLMDPQGAPGRNPMLLKARKFEYGDYLSTDKKEHFRAIYTQDMNTVVPRWIPETAQEMKYKIEYRLTVFDSSAAFLRPSKNRISPNILNPPQMKAVQSGKIWGYCPTCLMQ